jgi:phosphatidylserine/phosphatidylglycerophosphate/cardiolipin synthase-like enzyme
MKKIYLFLTLFIANIALSQTLEPIGTARLKANGTTVTVTGIVTNDALFDNRNRTRCFQDATGGLNIFAQGTPSAPALQALKPGDSIVITGVLAEFNNLKQLVEPLNIQVIASNKPVPAPIVVSFADLQNPAVAEPLESMLVKIEDMLIDTGDRIFGSGSAGRSYDIDEPNNRVAGNCFPVSADCNAGPVMRINPGNSLVGVEVPRGLVSITGNLGQFASAYQIVVRGIKDFEVGLALEKVEQTNIQTTSFELKFSTNQSAKSRVRWGNIFLVGVNTSDPTNYIADYDTTFVGEIVDNNFKLDHIVRLTGLNVATPYFVEIFCENANGKKVTFTDVYTTASESTGEIKVFFNKPVDASLSRNGAVATVVNNIDEIFASYIDRATTSVDVCIYNANIAGSAKIATALQNARARGVQVRYIFGGELANLAHPLLNNIPRMRDRNASGPAALQRTGTGNHNKFIVIDPNSRLNSYVITGSGNFTNNGLFDDPNNFLIIQDQALARAYRAEFDEMWGEGPVNPNSTQASPSHSDFDRQARSRFGGQKIKNTPSKFIIGDRLVELYFSPTDGPTNAIRNAIYSTDNDLRFGLLILTADELRVPIDSMQNVGWDVKGLIEDENAVADNVVSGSDFIWLRDRGVNVQTYPSGVTRQFHHKYAVIDAVRTTSDPMVVTGSFNWTSSAENNNDENLLIIHDAKIANMFRQEFGERWFEATNFRDAYLLALDEPNDISGAVVYPNPSQGKFTIRLSDNLYTSAQMRIVDLQGKIVDEQTLTINGRNLQVNTRLSKGMYILQLNFEGKTFTRKLVITE